MKQRLSLSVTLVLSFLIILLTHAYAEVDDSRFQAANNAYSQRNYAQAITLYEELIGEYGYSSGLLYNLAGSYAQSGQVGKAILNYERAARLSPSDPDILGNLQLVRSESGLFDTEPPLKKRLANLLPMHLWLLIIGVGLTGFTGILLAGLKTPISKRLLLTSCSVTFLLTAVAGFAVITQQRGWQQWVVINQAPLLLSPFDGASSAGTLNAGRLVSPGKDHGAFLFITDSTGRSGWIHQTAIEPIIAQSH